MQNPLLLALFIIGLCLFIVFYIVSAAFYYRHHKTKYHFYQMFPYELNYPSMFKQNIYGNLIYLLACISVIAFYQINPIKTLYSYLTIALSIVVTMLSIILLLFPLKYLKTHMVVSSLTMTICMAMPVINVFSSLSEMKLVVDDIHKALCIISMAISLALALSMMVLILNPKLSFKIYYEKATDEEGNEIKKRPGIIFIAFSEWWALFVFFLSPLAVLLLSII